MAFPTGWGRKCKITIPDAKISGSNSNFPVLLTKDNFPVEMIDAGANSALNGGGDVRFSEDAAGVTQLACDVVSFVTSATPSSRDAEIWVKFPTLNTGAAKDIYVWYSKAGETQPVVTDPLGRNAVWALAELVVLMDAVTPIDRTGGHTLSLTGSLTNIAGPYGKANSFAGSDRLSNTDVSLRDILTTYNTTISVISRRASYLSSSDAAVSWDGTDDFIIYPMDTNLGNGLRIFWRDLGGNIVNVNTESLANTWVHTSFTTRASNDHEAYTNGSSVGTSTGTGSVGPFTAFYMGGWPGQDWDGDIAQVIVWASARSADWITTEYNNQSDPATFATAGTPEAAGGISGSAAGTMGGWGSSASGAQTHSGSSAVTQGPVTANASGTVGSAISGSASAVLPAMINTGLGKLTHTGTATGVMASYVSAASGSLLVSGSGSGLMGAIIAAASGPQTHKGQASAQIPAAQASASGGQTHSGAIDAFIGAVVASATGGIAVNVTGSAAAFIGAATGSASGQAKHTGGISAQAPAQTSAAQGKAINSGGVNVITAALAAVSSGGQTHAGEIAAAIAAQTGQSVARLTTSGAAGAIIAALTNAGSGTVNVVFTPHPDRTYIVQGADRTIVTDGADRSYIVYKQDRS